MIHVNAPPPVPHHHPPMPVARRLFLATRPMFFPAALVPVAVGTAWGLDEAVGLRPGLLAAAVFGMLCLHAGANVINDVGDELNGCDRLNHDRIAPFTGGSRFIQDGLLSLRAMAAWGALLLACGAAIGGALTLAVGETVLVLGLIGGGLALAYSLPPFSLAARGLGEAAVALGFGLPVVASAWLQGGTVSLTTILAAATVGCWTAAILICNEVPDIGADAAAGKRTLVVRLGARSAPSLYVAVQAVAAALQLALGWMAELPPWGALPPLLTMLAALAAAPLMLGGRGGQLAAIHITLTIHLAGGVWLTVAALL